MNSNSIKYILDANVFMEASRRYYPFDFAKPFWEALVAYSQSGVLCSIDKVFNEINEGYDELKIWAENDFHNYFFSTQDSNILQSYSALVNWAQNQSQYSQIAKNIFMRQENADAWVIAFAHANNFKIVTHEIFDSNIKKRIPIPNVCVDFNISYCDTFEMLRSLQFSF